MCFISPGKFDLESASSQPGRLFHDRHYSWSVAVKCVDDHPNHPPDEFGAISPSMSGCAGCRDECGCGV